MKSLYTYLPASTMRKVRKFLLFNRNLTEGKKEMWNSTESIRYGIGMETKHLFSKHTCTFWTKSKD
jgi:hypothetical protein